jgi:hypothetical protein
MGYRLMLALLSASPVFAFVNGQYASKVIGQANFTTASAPISAATVKMATNVLYDDTHHRLFVTDGGVGNIRVLIFDTSGGITNGMNATWVLGQPDFTSSGSYWYPSRQDRFKTPGSLAYDPATQRLFVSDISRILVWDLSGGITNGMNATYVLGQPNFTASAPPPLSASATLIGLSSLSWDPEFKRLFVGGSNRVTVFDLSGGITNGMNASWVLGQSDFVSNSSGMTQSKFDLVMSLAYDVKSRGLFVGDQRNNRVLVFDLSAGITNGMNASYVLGQPDFTSKTAATGPSRTAGVWAVEFDPVAQRLFVEFSAPNYRVSIFDLSNGISNGMNASGILGAPSFYTSYTAGFSAYKLNNTWSISFDSVNRRLFAADGARVMIFDENDNTFGGTPSVCIGSTTTICGTVTAAENSAALTNVPVQLLDWQRKLLATQKTNTLGGFSFSSGLVLNSTYTVVPLVARTQSASPSMVTVPALTAVGATINLQIRGRTGTLQVTGNPPGSAVLISTASYPAADAPPINPSAPTAGIVSAAVELSGTATAQLPAGAYYVTCWIPQFSGASATYVRTPAAGSDGPFTINPDGAVSVTCN